jgi:hypothetical protein
MLPGTCTGSTGLEYKMSFENSVFSFLLSAQGVMNFAASVCLCFNFCGQICTAGQLY